MAVRRADGGRRRVQPEEGGGRQDVGVQQRVAGDGGDRGGGPLHREDHVEGGGAEPAGDAGGVQPGFIVSKKAVEKLGEGSRGRRSGPGPFAFASLTPNQSLELVAHEGYFRGKPKLAK